MPLSRLKSIFSVLELAERNAPAADVPADRRNELAYCEAKGLVKVSERAPGGWTPCRTIRKPATELKEGDVLQLQPDGSPGFTVYTSRLTPDAIRPHTVEVWNKGGDWLSWGYDAEVTLFVAPFPQRVYSESRLLLLPDGRAALAEWRMRGAGQQPTAAAERGGRPKQKTRHRGKAQRDRMPIRN